MRHEHRPSLLPPDLEHRNRLGECVAFTGVRLNELEMVDCGLASHFVSSKQPMRLLDRLKPSPLPDSWKPKEMFAARIILGGYLPFMTDYEEHQLFLRVSGKGFMARDIRFHDVAGPEKEHAVALRVNSQYSVNELSIDVELFRDFLKLTHVFAEAFDMDLTKKLLRVCLVVIVQVRLSECKVLNHDFHCPQCSSGMLSGNGYKLAKFLALPFSNTISYYTVPFDIVHSDVRGPSPASTKGGSKYYVSFMTTFALTRDDK
ncbi:gag-pol polyprotein [Tanacetum coccineum]